MTFSKFDFRVLGALVVASGEESLAERAPVPRFCLGFPRVRSDWSGTPLITAALRQIRALDVEPRRALGPTPARGGGEAAELLQVCLSTMIWRVDALITMPRLEGRGIVLRVFGERDVPLALQASKDPLIPLITTVPADGNADEALEWVRRQHQRLDDGVGYSFCIARASDDEPLGQIGLWPHRPGRGRASIGYWVGQAHRGAGVATAALGLLSAWGIDHPGIERLELYVEPWNEGSWRTAERVGFLREGLMRRWEAVGAERRDMFMYSLLPEDACH